MQIIVIVVLEILLGKWGQLIGKRNVTTESRNSVSSLFKTVFAPYIAKYTSKYATQDNTGSNFSMH